MEDRRSIGVKIKRTELTSTQLRAVAVNLADAPRTRRVLAMALVLEGASPAEVARQTGMDRQTLRDWVQRFNETAIEGLRPHPPPVRAGKVRKVHKVMRWRGLDLRAEVARRFSVTVDEITIGRCLGQMRRTRLQPRPYPPKKDPQAQAAFNKPSATA